MWNLSVRSFLMTDVRVQRRWNQSPWLNVEPVIEVYPFSIRRCIQTNTFSLNNNYVLLPVPSLFITQMWLHRARINMIHADTDTYSGTNWIFSFLTKGPTVNDQVESFVFSYILNWMSLMIWCWQQIVPHVDCATVLFWNSVRAHYSNWRHRQRPAATGPDVKGFYENP